MIRRKLLTSVHGGFTSPRKGKVTTLRVNSDYNLQRICLEFVFVNANCIKYRTLLNRSNAPFYCPAPARNLGRGGSMPVPLGICFASHG